jgi:ribosomal protein S18 acetylase RimI-like enzyme
MAKTNLALRPIRNDDLAFLYQVYASTREDELAPLPWTDSQKQTFLQMQFNAQHHYYQENFAKASYQVILQDEQPVGRLYVDRGSDEIRIIDIALLGAARNQRIGSLLLQQILDEATLSGRRVVLHVEKNNPALRLYQRLDFQVKEDKGVYWFMQWSPAK